ncbi:MAG: hypothetical protein WD294_06915 [Phycisphaeraceae bacterium]
MLGDDWPSPPAWQYLLVENPWPLGVIGVAAAVVLFVVGGRQGRGSLQLGALGALVAAIAVFTLAHLVETQREKLQFASREIVHAFADPFEPIRIERQIADDVTLFDTQVGHLMPVAEQAAEEARVTQYFIRDVRVDQDGPYHARTGVSVIGRMQHRVGETGFSIQAIFHWRKQPEGEWKLYRVRDLWFNGENAESLVREITPGF